MIFLNKFIPSIVISSSIAFILLPQLAFAQISAQSIVDNRLWLAQGERNSSPSSSNADSQGCVYEEKGAAGSGGKPTKLCKKPQFNGIRIDACLKEI